MVKAKYLDWDVEELEHLYIDENFPISSIAKIYHVSPRTVNRAISYFNLYKTGKTLDEQQKDIEEALRTSLLDYPRINEDLVEQLPISYSDDENLWIVNDYVSPYYLDRRFPVEIQIVYDRKTNSYDVKKAVVRGVDESSLKKAMQNNL